MKRIIFLLLIILLFSSNLFAQTYHELDKEGLRELLRKKGQFNFPEQTTISDNVNNFELFGLTLADTLTWYTSEEWIDKISNECIEIGWNEETPRKISVLKIKRGVSDTYFNFTPFMALEALYCSVWTGSSWGMTHYPSILDISINTKLKELDIRKSTFTDNCFKQTYDIETLILHDVYDYYKIDISMLPYLKQYKYGGHQDFSGNPLLEELILYRAEETFNILGNPNLKSLYIGNTGFPSSITDLDLSNNINLEELSLLDIPYLTSLDLSNNLKLKEISLVLSMPMYLISDSEGVEEITFGDINPEKLVINKYGIRKLDVSRMANLKYVDISDNSLMFSQFPRSNYETFIYGTSQNIHGNEAYPGQIIDFTGEYMIDGYETTFNGTFSDNGYIKIPDDMMTDFIYPVILKNERFPGVSVRYELYIKDQSGFENLEKQSVCLQSSKIRAGEDIVILSDNLGKGKALLYNVSGKLISKTDIDGNNIAIRSPSVSGIYILHIISGTGEKNTEKLIVY